MTSALIQKCSKCGEPTFKEIEMLGKVRLVPRMCKCKKEEFERMQREEEAKEKQQRLKSLFTNSLMDSKFFGETFENWDETKGNNKYRGMAEKYCNRFSEVKKQGLGFLFYGTPGNGKTYLSNCIANRLLNDCIPVISTSVDGILNRIKQTYNKWGKEGEETILNSLSYADLVIIDDLGTEDATGWSVSKVYNIIDRRYRNKLPMIVSTNVSIEELKEIYSERTIDRLLEMCTPIKFTGESIRKEKSKENSNLLREIMRG